MDPWKVWTGHEEEFNVVFNYYSVPSWNNVPVHPVIWTVLGDFGLDCCSQQHWRVVVIEQGNSREHQLQLGESCNWLQMGVLLEHENKKLIVIHGVIFREVGSENNAYEIVSRVQIFEIKFFKQTNTKLNCFPLDLSNVPWNNWNRLIEGILQSRL